MGMDDVGERGLKEKNYHMFDNQKEFRNGLIGEGQGLVSSKVDEEGADAVEPDINSVPGRAIQVQSGLQITQQQSQPVIHWERFLPKRSLKVLLVENDDSTRHVVSALLRNCSYEVTSVANGIQAWRILEDLTNPIDLVLTEVVMPIVSGISLLYKIMSHKTLKNIPVIMMSSHDSMGIVFKCLSKGAVDFLVKPIRKNELRNLWQHVWRRCHSSSGSGSESGTQSKQSIKPKNNGDSDTNTGSNNEHDNGSNLLNVHDRSDTGSGTQSSWTKRAAEVDSSQPVSPWDQSDDTPDSTCAQVIHTKPEIIGEKRVHMEEQKEGQEQNEQLDLDIRLSRNSDLQSKHPEEDSLMSKRHNKVPEADIKVLDRGLLEPYCENLRSNLKDQFPCGSSAIANSTNPQAESRTFNAPSVLSNISEFKVKVSCGSGELPSLELSLKRLRGVEEVRASVNDDSNVLRHSDLSAFSKYNTTSSANQVQNGNVGSCSPLENYSFTKKTERMQNFPYHSNSTPPNQQSNESSNNNDMASTKYVSVRKENVNDNSESISGFKCFYSSAIKPDQGDHLCPPQQVIPAKAEDVGVDSSEAKSKDTQQFQVQHHHHYYHHFHHHVHDMQQHQPQDDCDTSDKKLPVAAPQCGSSNVFGGPTEGNTRNYSVNGSASGSNHGSNGQYGSNTVLNAGPVNLETDNGAAGNSEAGGISRGISASGVDEDRVAQREAALIKFRQKRKDRCFEKKVRYQSRKRLAEQRPRIRGQFVRHIGPDTKEAKDYQANGLMSEENPCDGVQ